MKDFHKKPLPQVRCVRDALANATRLRRELPKIAQVNASDWDLVILADDWLRQAKVIDKFQLPQPGKE